MISSRSNSFFIQSETDRSDLSSNISFRVLLSSTQTPSVQHKDHTFSAPEIPQFNTKNPSVQHEKPLSSTPKNVQFHIPLISTPKNPQFNTSLSLYRAFLSVFLCWTERFLMWSWWLCGTEGFFGLELWGRLNWGAEKEWSFCVE